MKLSPRTPAQSYRPKRVSVISSIGEGDILVVDSSRTVVTMSPTEFVEYCMAASQPQLVFSLTLLTATAIEALFAATSCLLTTSASYRPTNVTIGKTRIGNFTSLPLPRQYCGDYHRYLVDSYDTLVGYQRQLYDTFGVQLHSTLSPVATDAARLHLTDSYHELSPAMAVFCDRAFVGGYNLAVVGEYRNEPHYLYDYNAMYGSILQTCPLPTGKPLWVFEETPDSLGIYNCLVSNIKAVDRLRPLAVTLSPIASDKATARPFIADGERVNKVLTSIDIASYRQAGATVEVIDGVVWYSSATPFSTFIDNCAQVRSSPSASQAMRATAKQLQNRLYGVLGQRIINTNYVFCTDHANPAVEGLPLRDGQTFIYEKQTVSIGDRNKFVATHWAAFIAAYARAKLFDAILVAGSNNVCYCATDSLLVNAEGHRNITANTALCHAGYGGLRLERHYTGVVVTGINRYAGISVDDGRVYGAATGALVAGDEEASLAAAYKDIWHSSASPLPDLMVGGKFENVYRTPLTSVLGTPDEAEQYYGILAPKPLSGEVTRRYIRPQLECKPAERLFARVQQYLPTIGISAEESAQEFQRELVAYEEMVDSHADDIPF